MKACGLSCSPSDMQNGLCKCDNIFPVSFFGVWHNGETINKGCISVSFSEGLLKLCFATQNEALDLEADLKLLDRKCWATEHIENPGLYIPLDTLHWFAVKNQNPCALGIEAERVKRVIADSPTAAKRRNAQKKTVSEKHKGLKILMFSVSEKEAIKIISHPDISAVAYPSENGEFYELQLKGFGMVLCKDEQSTVSRWRKHYDENVLPTLRTK